MLYESLSLEERSLGGMAWHIAILAGFHGRSLNTLARYLALKPAALAELIGLGPTIYRANDTLPAYASDTLYRIALAFQRASLAFRENERAAAWLTAPLPALAGHSPLHLMLSDVGAKEVWIALEKIPKKVAKERENHTVEE